MFDLFKGEGKDPVLLLLFYGGTVARCLLPQFTTYYMLWITGFTLPPAPDAVQYEPITKAEATKLFNNVTTTGMIATTIFLLPLVGAMSGRVPTDLQIVAVFGFRMVATAAFFILADATSSLAYMTALALWIAT